MHFSFAYVRPNLLAKERFWYDLQNFSENLDESWILLRDLNDIASSNEQWGSERVNENAMNRFVTTFTYCRLQGLDSAGPRFTWCRQVGGRTIVRRRLDMVLWNMKAQMRMPEVKVIVLLRFYSYHNPI